MGLSFVLYCVPSTFECSKLWPLQPLQPLKPLLDFRNSALGKNLPYREEKYIFFSAMKKYEILEDFFFRGDEKKQHKNGEGIRYRLKESKNHPS